jgi:hypothetical protein
MLQHHLSTHTIVIGAATWLHIVHAHMVLYRKCWTISSLVRNTTLSIHADSINPTIQFDYHSLIQLFAHVFHWHSCVIRKELHAHHVFVRSQSRKCRHYKPHNLNDEVNDMCLWDPKVESVGITNHITWMTKWMTCVYEIPDPKV